MTSAPEFSRPVLLARIGHEPLRREIAAADPERAALARRFGLLALNRLTATVELQRRGGEMILLRAAFEGEFVQECVVTLDPVPGAVAEEFELLYGPPEIEEAAAGAVSDAAAFEPLNGDTIDIGEAVAQEFSLSLPPFPRSPAAEEAETTAVSGDASPFAALSRLFAPRGEEGE